MSVLLSANNVFAAEAVPSQNAISVNLGGETVKIEAAPAYVYKDNNYFMLRDMGRIIGYRVDWQAAAKEISLTKDSSAKNIQGSATAKAANNVTPSVQTITVDGKEYKDISCLNIDGYNYFKLRDMAEAMNVDCDWDNNTKTVTISEKNNEAVSDISSERLQRVKGFLDPDLGLEQKIIEEDIEYVYGSHDYKAIEGYFKRNIDENFSLDDFIITDAYNLIIMRLDVNGVLAMDYGYTVTLIDGQPSIITFVGEKNEDIDITKLEPSKLTDDEAKKKAIEAYGFDCHVDEQRITRYFSMKDLVYQCEVETVYGDEDGLFFATSHVF